MRTRLAREMGLEFPIFAFSHCRDVVAAVSRAGGMGVLGALYFTPDELEIELKWIDEHVDGKPYGVDLVMPAKVQLPEGVDADEPRGHSSRSMITPGAPRLGREGARRARRAAAARRRRARPPPARLDRRDRAPAARHRAAALAVAARERARAAAQGHRRHRARARHQGRRAREQPRSTRRSTSNIGVDIVVAQGTEAGGHTGEISSMVLWPRGDRGDCADTPVLAAGGIAHGSQIAAALAMGAQGVWTGSIWLTCAESDMTPLVIEKLLARRLVADGALARAARQARAPAAHRVDRRVGPRRLPRLPADADAVHARRPTR